jgi:hypothetical protein
VRRENCEAPNYVTFPILLITSSLLGPNIFSKNNLNRITNTVLEKYRKLLNTVDRWQETLDKVRGVLTYVGVLSDCSASLPHQMAYAGDWKKQKRNK